MSNRKWLSSRRAIRGLKWFIALSIVGLLLNFFFTSLTESFRYLTQLNPLFLIIALALNVCDWILGGTRLLVLSARLFPQIKFKACLKSYLGNLFLGAVTPAQTGGGAAQIYVLYKNGMPFAEATMASLVSFLGSVFFLVACALYLLCFDHALAMHSSLLLLPRFTLLVFSVILLFLIVVVAKPQTFENVTKRFLSVIPILKKLLESDKLQVFFDSVQKYQAIARIYASKGKLAFLAMLMLSSVAYLNKFFIAYIVLKGMGLDAPFIQTILIQMILCLIVYLSPTPGAAGVAELSSARLMGTIIPESSLAIFAMLWRTFTLYISVAVGGVIMLKYLLAQDSLREK